MPLLNRSNVATLFGSGYKCGLCLFICLSRLEIVALFFVFVSVYVWHAVANLHKSICREKSIYEKWLPDILINGNDSDNDNDYDNGPALSQIFYLRFQFIRNKSIFFGFLERQNSNKNSKLLCWIPLRFSL